MYSFYNKFSQTPVKNKDTLFNDKIDKLFLSSLGSNQEFVKTIAYYLHNSIKELKNTNNTDNKTNVTNLSNLINLISNQQIIPEMLQDNCCKEKLAKLLEKLILDKNFALKQIEDSKFALNLMGLQSLEKSSAKAAKEILNDK